MNLRIRRRRFGQIVIASAATTAIANFTGKAIAQTSEPVIYGLNLANNAKSNTLIDTVSRDTVSNLVNKIDDVLELAKSTPEVVISALNPVTGKEISTAKILSRTVENLNTRVETVSKAIFTQPRERLTGITALSNDSFIISSVISSKNGDSSRLIFVDFKSLIFRRGLKISGFKTKTSTIESLLATKDNKLMSVISLNGGTPPFDLALIDPQTGKITAGDKLAFPELPTNQRFSHLTQAPDGKIYATNLDHEGATCLVEFDLENKSIVTGKGTIKKLATLRFEKNTLGNDLVSLACSSLGELFAIADIKNEGTNSLFSINVKTGEMQLIRKFPFSKITFAR